jgi:dTDP-4-amino-4,6-dideoxygalactose transaminase
MDQSFPFLDLSRQHKEIETEINEVLRKVLSKGIYILGDEVSTFELEWAEYCGAAGSAGINSGTDAISLALTASGAITNPGVDEVITSSFSAGYTALAILQAGAVPVFADVNADDLLINAGSFEQLITSNTRAIVPVYLYGQTPEMEAIFGIANRYGLRVIEDAAQAHGAWRNKTYPKSSPRIAAFSFYPTKNLGAYGDGGAVVSDDKKLIEEIKSLRQGGHPSAMDKSVTGRNSRLDEIQAAILRIKLKYLDNWNDRRRRWAEIYTQMLGATDAVLPVSDLGRANAHHLYVIQSKLRDELRSFLAANNIPTMVHYPTPLHKLKLFERQTGAEKRPVAEAATKRVLSLPLNSHSLEREVVRTAESILRFNA